jgi:hypothetical protein
LIKKWASAEKLAVSADELGDVIEGLVETGKLSVYRFSKPTERYEMATFVRTDVQDLWFRSK